MKLRIVRNVPLETFNEYIKRMAEHHLGYALPDVKIGFVTRHEKEGVVGYDITIASDEFPDASHESETPTLKPKANR